MVYMVLHVCLYCYAQCLKALTHVSSSSYHMTHMYPPPRCYAQCLKALDAALRPSQDEEMEELQERLHALQSQQVSFDTN